MSADEPLQFDRVEPARPAEAAAGQGPGESAGPEAPRCAGCAAPLVESYFLVNGKVACAACAQKVTAQPVVRPNVLAVVGVGAGSVLAAALLVYGVRAATGYELGLISIGVGLIVGGAVRWAAGGRPTRGTRWVAAVLTYAALALTYAPAILEGLLKTPVPRQGAPFGATIGVLLIVIAPVIAVFEGPLSIVISGIAIWEAWKLNKPNAPVVTGPHRLTSVPAAAPAPAADPSSPPPAASP